ncbi:hypothetical protein AVEN_40732-1, partial [Araneus ventricosus]
TPLYELPHKSKRGRSAEPCEGLAGWGRTVLQPLTFLASWLLAVGEKVSSTSDAPTVRCHTFFRTHSCGAEERNSCALG